VKKLAWTAACCLVVLASRTLAYALAPRPSLLGGRLEHAAGGPKLVTIAIVAIVLGSGVSAGLVWLAALGVSERARLSRQRFVELPRLRLGRVLVGGVGLWLASSIVFTVVESYIHWRAGMGWHGLHCLLGPVHRNAIPILAALSLVASAAVAAGSHLLAWMRRTIALLAGEPPTASSQPYLGLTPRYTAPARFLFELRALQPRPPPRPSGC
jgi:hypothetical protein